MQAPVRTRKLNLPVVLGIAAGALVLALWLSVIAFGGLDVRSIYLLKWAIYLIITSSFVAGFTVYEFLNRKYRSSSDKLLPATSTKLGSHTSDIKCPACGSPMVKRLAKGGPARGEFFFGCSQFPRCTKTRSMEDAIWHNKPLKLSIFRD